MLQAFLCSGINIHMAVPFTSNNGSTFYNINDCRSFTQPISTSLVALSAYPCSEAVLWNKGATAITIYDNDYSASQFGLTLSAGESFTLRGLTNTLHVSAISPVGAGALYFRTQYFSYLPQR